MKILNVLLVILTLAIVTFGQLSPCSDLRKRRSDFNRATSEVRAAAVLTHLYSLRQADGIAAEQIAAVDAIIPFITSDVYSEVNRKALDPVLVQRVEAAFDSDKWRRSLTLGEEAGLVLAKASLHSPIYQTASFGISGDCGCAYNRAAKKSGDCYDVPCHILGGCTVSTWGCGFFWTEICNGQCGNVG